MVTVVERVRKGVAIKDVISPFELLEHITIDEIMAYYHDKQYMILDRIGKDKVMEYFNLSENDNKNGGTAL